MENLTNLDLLTIREWAWTAADKAYRGKEMFSYQQARDIHDKISAELDRRKKEAV